MSHESPKVYPLHPQMPIAHAAVPATHFLCDWIRFRRIRAGHSLFDSLSFVYAAYYERHRSVIHGTILWGFSCCEFGNSVNLWPYIALTTAVVFVIWMVVGYLREGAPRRID